MRFGLVESREFFLFVFFFCNNRKYIEDICRIKTHIRDIFLSANFMFFLFLLHKFHTMAEAFADTLTVT